MAVNRRRDGKYSAQYYHGGERFSVSGSFDTKEKAAKAAEKAKASHEFRPRPEQVGELLFRDAAEQMLRQSHAQPNTLVNYRSILNKHVLPVLADVPVTQITRGSIKRLLLRWEEEGMSRTLRKHAKSVISSVLQVATEDGLLAFNPARGIDLGRSDRKTITIFPEETILAIAKLLPTEGARLWLSIQISTGCRLNEIRGLRPKDFVDDDLHIVSVVNETKSWKKNKRPQFERRGHTKNGDVRRITIPRHLSEAVKTYVERHTIADDEPLFTQRRVVPPLKPRARDIEIPEDLDMVTASNGRKYQHGTVNAYVTAKCRCNWCRAAIRQQRRRNASYTKGTIQWRNPDEFVTEAQWDAIWSSACTAAGLADSAPTAYQMRHTHASWLIDKGMLPVKVMHRLGHRDLAVTQRYVHPVNDDRDISDVLDSMPIWD